MEPRLKTCRDAGTDAGTTLVAVDASSAVPSSVPLAASIDANNNAGQIYTVYMFISPRGRKYKVQRQTGQTDM